MLVNVLVSPDLSRNTDRIERFRHGVLSARITRSSDTFIVSGELIEVVHQVFEILGDTLQSVQYVFK